MRYAIFSDIHANLTALRAVWNALEIAGLSDLPVLNAGDTVGYGPDPEACVQFLSTHPNCVSVKGNYDKNIALFPEREAEYRKKWHASRPEKFESLREGSKVISTGTRLWLRDLPAAVRLNLEGTLIFLTHYSPGSKEGLGSWTSDARLAELAPNTDAQVVVCGHTHTPFVRFVGGKLWVNPGSLGRSWDGRFRYAELILNPNQPPRAELKTLR